MAVVQEITADDSKAIRAYQRMVDHLKKIEGGLEKITAKSKDADSAQDRPQARHARGMPQQSHGRHHHRRSRWP
jgi:hypothetical protein